MGLNGNEMGWRGVLAYCRRESGLDLLCSVII